jgi:hypothetical protein
LTPEKSYQLFVALKLHFTTKYDFFKYNGKTNQKVDLQGKKDKWNYVGLAKKYEDRLQDFYVANFIASEVTWSGHLMRPEADKVYVDWRKRIESLTYIISEDCDSLVEFLDQKELQFDDLFKVKGGQHPLLLRLFFQNHITLETLLTFASILKFVPKWDRDIEDDIVWPEVSTKLKKYRPFIELDKPKLKHIIREKFNDRG